MTRLASILVAIALVAGASEAHASKRAALIIGNSAYQNVPQLPNPLNDAKAIGNLFETAGFDVVSAKTNLGNLEFKRALREFTFAARDADIAVIYYAGHGIEVKGTNYLIPTDAKLASDYDAEDETVSLTRIVESLESVKRLRLVILDACRDNPFAKTMQRTMASRAVAAGLAKVEPGVSDTLIAYAAKAGSTAEDGTGANSPFAAALIKHLIVPGRDIRIALGHVRDEVLGATNRKQEPFVYGSLGGASLALVAAAEPRKVEVATPAPAGPSSNDIRRDYELAAQIGTKEALDSFLAAYSTGLYADLARAQRTKILALEKAQADAAAAKIKADAAEKVRAEAATAEAAKAAEARAKTDAAEKAKAAAETAKAAAAAERERARADAAEKALQAAMAEKAKAVAQAKETAEAADKAKTDKTAVAALPPAAATPDQKPALPDLPRQLQAELRRVGCATGNIDNEWSAGARQALERFNRHSGSKLDAKVASIDALDAVKAKGSRVCPLSCERGFRVQGETCVAIVCKAGQVLDSDGDCVSPKEKKAARPEAKPAERKEPKSASAPAAPSQVVCNRGGCEQVRPGCRAERVRLGGQQSESRVVCP